MILDISTFFLAFSLGRSGSDFDFRRKLLRTFHGITNGVPSTLSKNKNCSQKQKVQLTSFILVPVRATNSEWSSRTVQLKLVILVLCQPKTAHPHIQGNVPKSSISSFELTQNQNRELQLARSRRPFGISCSDWYHIEARELYFLFL